MMKHDPAVDLIVIALAAAVIIFCAGIIAQKKDECRRDGGTWVTHGYGKYAQSECQK